MAEGKAGAKPGIGHRWTREEALAAAEKAKLSPNIGRPSRALNEFADQAIEMVLRDDHDIVRRATDPKPGEKRPSVTELRGAKDRIVKVGARRVTGRSELEVGAISQQRDELITEHARLATPEQVALLEQAEALEKVH